MQHPYRALAHLSSLLLVVVLAGCAMPMSTGGAPAAIAPAPVAGALTVANVRARPAPLAGGNAAAFLTVLNGTDAAVQLTGVQSSVAQATELHETTSTNGVMKMEPRPAGFTIPAGGSVDLAPGGKHVMLINLAQPLTEGQAFTLTLNFDTGASLVITVPVVAMDAAGAMPAANAMPAAGAMDGMGASASMTGTAPMTDTQP